MATDAAVIVDANVADAGCPDDDGDGVCNAVDDWPCGAKPTTLPATNVQWSGNNGATDTQISNTNLDATGRLAVATKSETINLKFSFAIDDQACAGNCIDQIEIGWSVAPGDRLQNCAWDNQVPKQSGATGNVNMSVATPATNGVYDLRVNLGQNISCGANGHTEWWGYQKDQDPPASRTIAKLCVH